MPSHFKFKEYCPMVFRNLRERFNVDDIDYMVGVSLVVVMVKLWVQSLQTNTLMFIDKIGEKGVFLNSQ